MIFIVQLKFSEHKDKASHFMTGHNAWIKQGFDDGVFLMAGALQPQLGGCVMAHNLSRSELESRVNDDPFVAENVVRAEILEINPAKVDERLSFLLASKDQA